MAKRKPEEPKAGAAEWLGTFSDLVTLLMCFWVLLYSMSNVDESKFTAMAQSFSGDPMTIADLGGGNGVSSMLGGGIMDLPALDNDINNSMYEYMEKQEQLNKAESEWKTYFAENEELSEVELVISEKDIRMLLPERILYDSGSALLRLSAYDTLQPIGSQILKYPNTKIIIEGHTDSNPINTAQFRSNWELSFARAMSVTNYFTDVIGIPPENITPQGLGQYTPVADNGTAEGRQRNRRVEIVLITGE